MKLKIAGLVLVCAVSASAQKLDVKIVERQDNETNYTYVVQGYSVSNSATNVNCNGDANNVNCNGSTNTSSTNTPAQQVSYPVRGATFYSEVAGWPSCCRQLRK
jgi:hypothetical protein